MRSCIRAISVIGGEFCPHTYSSKYHNVINLSLRHWKNPMNGILQNHFITGALLCGAALLCIGCGGSDQLPTYPVQGNVIFNGKPLQQGSVTFIPENGPYASGRISSDGTFELTTYAEGDGAIAGMHRILVSAVKVDPNHPQAVPLIPFKYGSEQTSGLTATVEKSDTNKVTLELAGQPGR